MKKKEIVRAYNFSDGKSVIITNEKIAFIRRDAVEFIGFKSRTSEILNRKQKLSLEMIRQLHDALNISTDVLIQTYS